MAKFTVKPICIGNGTHKKIDVIRDGVWCVLSSSPILSCRHTWIAGVQVAVVCISISTSEKIKFNINSLRSFTNPIA